MQFNEEMATEYDKGIRRTFPSYDSMFKLVQAYLRTNTEKDANILIVGAGGGTELALLGPTNPDWLFTAVDPARPMLDLARTKVEQLKMTDRVDFIEGTIEEVADGNLYDAATFLLVLHFIADNDEKLRQLKSIRQRLKPNAPFVLATMYGDLDDSGFNALFSLWKAYWLDSTNLSEVEVDEMEKSVRSLSFISEDEIELLLREAGFGSIAKFHQTNMFGGWICKAE
ncbi:class I SAM-dependent methyltransferase [Sporosarcina sp. Marseille-Q4063]|uniref:class I SAM-dependent methyltransferase n=1 Tax=Sporosarcina sp. Marseille-Q4063 TaxID=2810514 RepID=UPI001BB05B67|nr:class I SAM-dependent methyltransferase [Sporosarcina sp. Marseille-Q4063]QUW23641.1 class I SAM-dependent methyltransferase [Sporosarcina sp. Marseille-Q4063]